MFDYNQKFLKEIELFCVEANCQIIDGVIYWCEKNNIEVEYIAGLIKKDPVFKAKIQIEAEILNIVKKDPKLPI